MLLFVRPCLVVVTVFAIVATPACGEDAGNDAAREEITQVIEQGRQALVQGQASNFCALLTSQARAHSLGYAAEYNGSGSRSPARAPKTCTAAITDQLRFARAAPGGLQRLRAADGELSFVSVKARSAQVRLSDAGVDIYFVKTPEGWRADRTDDFPWDGGTGA